MRKMLTQQYWLLLAIVLMLAGNISCSVGDQQSYFRSCVKQCQQLQPTTTRWFEWEPLQECQYKCMMYITEEQQKFNQPIMQYFGKWPFHRFMGLQEPVSVLFSLMNCLAHVYGWKRYKRHVERTYEFFNLVCINALVNIFGWSCAAIFHSKDTLFTERLDYYSAAAIMCYSIFLCIARIVGKVYHKISLTCGALLMVLLGVHICRMTFVKFDYGLNMIVMVTIGVTNALMWLAWSFKNRRRDYAWKCSTAMVGTMIFASLEVWDFEPIWLVLDAHSLWHLATVPLTFLWYRFLTEDALFEWKVQYKIT